MDTIDPITIPDELPVIFLTDTVIYPYAVMPLGIQKEGSKAAIRHALMGNRLIVGVKANETENYGVGTLCRVAQQCDMPDGSLQVIVQGLERVRLVQAVQEEPFITFRVLLCPDPEASDDADNAMQQTATSQFLRLAKHLPDLPSGMVDALPSLETPLQAAYVIAYFLPMASLQHQKVLEADSIKEKFEIITTFLTQELARVENEQKNQATPGNTRQETPGAPSPVGNSLQQVIPAPAFQQKKTVGVMLGKDITTNNDVTIAFKNRLTGMYVIGANGTGKSTLLEQLIVQDIEAGMGVCLLDPHGDLTNNVINRIPERRLGDAVLLDPLDVEWPFGLNLFTCSDTSDPVAVEHAVEQIVQIFSKVFGMSVETPRLNQYVRHIAYTLVGTPYTMVEIPNLLLEKDFRDKVVPRTGSTGLFWKSYDNMRTHDQIDNSASTRDRIDMLVSNSIIRNVVGQSKTTINFREIMDTGKILLVPLSARYESMTSLLGSIIIGQLLTASLSRATVAKRRQFNLYADEYQRFATPDFATLLTEARKFGIATTIAHQVRSQLDEKNASTALQAGSLVCFRLTSEDAEELAPSFILTPPTETIERSVRAPAQNVIETLINRGSHEDPRVNEFVQKYLRPLSQAVNDKIEYRRDLVRPRENEIFPRKIYPEGSYAYDPRRIKEELNILNTELFAVMTTGKTSKPDYIRQWATFGQYLGFSHYMFHKDVTNLRSWDSMMVLNLVDQLLDTNYKTPQESTLDLMGQLKAPLFYATHFDPIGEEGFPLELTYFYTSFSVTPDIKDLYRVAVQIISAEKKRMEAYWTSFEGTVEGLTKSPVLIDSGKIEYIQQQATTYSGKPKD